MSANIEKVHFLNSAPTSLLAREVGSNSVHKPAHLHKSPERGFCANSGLNRCILEDMNIKIVVVLVAAVVLIVGGYIYYSAMVPSETTVPVVENKEEGAASPEAAGGFVYGNKTIESSAGTYVIRYDTENDSGFQVVRNSDQKVVADYTSSQDLRIICETVCYPYAQWLSDTEIMIGTYSKVSNPANEFKIRKSTVTVLNLQAGTERAPTQSELSSFDLYNDPYIWSE